MAPEANADEWNWIDIGSCDAPLDNKGDRLKRNATIVKALVSVDFFTVPTIRFLYVFLILAHDRRRPWNIRSNLLGAIVHDCDTDSLHHLRGTVRKHTEGPNRRGKITG